MFAKHYGKLTIMIAFGLLILALSCGDDPLEPIIIELGGTMVVAHVPSSDAITIDGVPDATWDRAKKFQIVAKSSIGSPTVIDMKAATDSAFFYMLVSWEDPTRDVEPDHWLFTDSTGGHVMTGGQDFFFMVLDDGRNGDVGGDCAQMCHTVEVPSGDSTTTVDSMRNSGTGMVDAWIWRSGQTDPSSVLDDMHFLAGDIVGFDLTVLTDPIWGWNIVDPDSVRDPVAMHRDSLFYTGEFLYRADSVEFKGGFKGPQGEAVFWPYLATVPGYVVEGSPPNNPDESLWEVVAKGAYDDLANRWTLEIRRKMNTGHSDDIPFVLGERLNCSAGIKNSPVGNSPYPHYATEPFDIQF
ncbi:MAG: hypothetical protein KKG33_12255 [candidate division Zixibacteria bacterium]|nr:hypothetical protein [candidate division Zixibacteria bacterium]MBU1471547.1 hypothetical protein [candidate division Zixibacteria bacterium]MBU2626322.1 hypothetical protein [candidate division Zixibacteria bacterium]